MFRSIFYYAHDQRDSDEKLIAINLENILATKKGYGCFLEEFGLDNGDGYVNKNNVDDVKEQIQQNIELYEKRIEVLNIEFIGNVDNIFCLLFQIQCKFKKDQTIHSFLFNLFRGTIS